MPTPGSGTTAWTINGIQQVLSADGY